MKRFFAVAAALAGLFVMPMAAHATTNSTIHVNGVPIDVGPAGCVAGDLVISGNGVLHLTVNNAGDSWLTGTIEGPVTDTAAGYTGQGAAWFGVEDNNQNFVAPFIADSVGTLADGTALRIHQVGQFTVNAQGLPVVNQVTTTCS
jgi:predicted phage gp36 major capsid-like protein